MDEQLSKLALLNQEVCGYFGLYQETVTTLKEACAQVAESTSGPKIQSALETLDSQYLKCEERKSCISKLGNSQVDNMKKIRNYMGKYQHLNEQIKPQALAKRKTVNFEKEIEMLQKSLSEDEIRQKEHAQALVAKEVELQKSQPTEKQLKDMVDSQIKEKFESQLKDRAQKTFDKFISK